ncbi:LOW QUALITY PROTEIN: hypothetical protein Cgig2_017929 [Carnegiea gigantea]|uniref:PB1-like domain-containing protein n=1 Tax=Carnegiea gigantea TaxID=171969 RepID=A0A9Q1KB54_9CARY|nr:LOW QUALITY PROTEIN: hypothetical protein Cgig2_017929 [Carnegiea gigantea]
MSVHDIVVEIHYGGNFVDGDKVEYVGGGVSEIEPVDIDRLSSILKARGKRKINVGGGVDDDGCENNGDEHDWDTDIEDEWETDVEDLETSDEEWAAIRAKVGECKKQKGSGRIDNTEQARQDMTPDKSSTSGIEQTQLGSNFHSDYETFETEMDTDGETDGDVPKLLRKKDKHIKVNEHTDFKKLKSQSLLMATHLHRKGNGADQGNNLTFLDIPPSSGPQSMTDQGQSLIFSQTSVAISSSQPFVSPL